jgi:hypothetical protein
MVSEIADLEMPGSTASADQFQGAAPIGVQAGVTTIGLPDVLTRPVVGRFTNEKPNMT